MSHPAHPHAMRPAAPGATRTAPPLRPPKFPFGGRYLSYTLFDATGLVYLAAGFVALRAVWALGSGPEAWQALQDSFRHPAYLIFHLLALASVVFVAVRFFRLFPKAQPPRLGPAKPPPRPLILAGLYAAWLGVTALFSAILVGRLLP